MSLSKKEQDEVRTWLVSAVANMLGYPESTVVNAALNCVQKGMDRQSTCDMLSRLLEDSAPSFVNQLFYKLEEIKSGGRGQPSTLAAPIRSKRSVKDAFGDEGGEETTMPIPKRFKSLIDPKDIDDIVVPTAAPTAPAPQVAGMVPGSLDKSQISAMLAKTRQQIEEKKAALEAQRSAGVGVLPTPVGLPVVPPAALPVTAPAMAAVSQPVMPVPAYIQMQQQNIMSEAKEKVAELHKRIQEQLAGANIANKLADKPTPLILDEKGRTVDATGKAIQLTQRQTTILANQRAKKREQFKIEKPTAEDMMETTYYDPRVEIKPAQRAKRGFKFHEAGKFQALAQKLRTKKKLEDLQEQIAAAAKKTGISSATKLALITPAKDVDLVQVPDVEWWDKAVLPVGGYDEYFRRKDAPSNGDAPEDIKSLFRNISHLVEHPIPYEPPTQAKGATVIPLMLTQKERKKLRSQRRREVEQEKQEKISLGLEPPPPPKVKLSNLMRVLGNDAIQDPTKMEAYVRSEMAKRQRAHEEANAARKLTPAQRKEKKMRKLEEDTTTGVHVHIYRIHDLTDPKVRYKVDINAQQYHLTGCIVQSKGINLVVVEGGPKALKKYQRLMLHRIKWEEARRNMDKKLQKDDEDSDKPNQCVVVWEGTVDQRSFPDWKAKQCTSEAAARDYLKKFGVAQYWDLALSQSIIESTDD